MHNAIDKIFFVKQLLNQLEMIISKKRSAIVAFLGKKFIVIFLKLKINLNAQKPAGIRTSYLIHTVLINVEFPTRIT